MSQANNRVFLPTSKPCFVCGEHNPAGLQIRFFVEDDVVKARLNPEEHHCGYPNVVHGGIVAAVLDECMGWAASRSNKRMCFTGEMTVRYLRPVPADRATTACCEVVKPGRRMVTAKGCLVDDDGVEYARSEGRFIPLSIEETLHVDDNLLYQGDEERVFDCLREEAVADGCGTGE